MVQEFVTATNRRKPVDFSIDGEAFTFAPPKQAGMILDYLQSGDEIGALFDWVNEGLGEEQANRVEERLKDPDDEFDIDDLTRIAQWLVEKSSGRPTKPPRGSLRRR